MFSDLRIAARGLARSPGFAISSVAALALGIGANSAIFSLVNQVLLNPAGITDPERLVAVRVKYEKLNLLSIPLSAPNFRDVRDSRDVFEHTAVMSEGDYNYTGGEVPERLRGAGVSAEWFDVFGARPRLGRVFREEEDRPNTNRVVVLADATWKRVFGGNPGILGQTIELNNIPYQIIGVMPPEFRWPRQVELWTPLGIPDVAFTERARFNERYFAVSRMKPGVTLEKANAWSQVLSDRVRNAGTDGAAYAKDSAWGMFTVPLIDLIAGDTKRPLLVLLGAVGFVLLIACSNTAGLMLARTSFRAREIAVRAALGAGRWQLLRQTLSECLLLSGAGGILGLTLAYAGMRALLLFAPENAAAGLEARLDVWVLVFTALVAIASGILFSLAPAWQTSRIDPHETLKFGGRSSTAARAHLRAALVIGETALALVLLVGAGLLLRSLARLQTVNPGFDSSGIVTATLSLPRTQYREPEKQIAFFRSVLENLTAEPAIARASLGTPVPFGMGYESGSFSIEGRPTGPGDPGPHGQSRWVAPGYFEILGIPLKGGRYFTDQDRQSAEPVMVIDDVLARQYWPNENPIGKRMRRGSRAPWATIVGIVGAVKDSDLAAETIKGTYYHAMYQTPVPGATILVKGRGDSSSLLPAIRQAVRAADPAQPVHTVRSLEDMVAISLTPRRFVMRLLAFFAAVALFMAALGLYGVISYSVAQRTQEIGIRMALGAERRAVLGLVIGHGLRLAGAGLLLGLLASIASGRLLEAQLFGVSAIDPLTFGLMAAVLLIAALLASYIPAGRAAKVDPIEALRYE